MQVGNNKHQPLAFVLAGLLAWAVASCTPAAPSASAPATSASAGPIVIGQITQLTGSQAGTGEWWRAGVKMAVDEWNARGGARGRPIELDVEDDASSTTGAVNAFNKLVAEKHPVAVIGSTYTNSIMAMEPAVKKASIPVLTGASGDPVTAAGDPWLFRIRTNDTVQAGLAAKYAVEQMGVKRPATLHVTGDFGVAGAETYKKQFDALGAAVVADESYNPDDKDITAQLLTIQRAGADAIFGVSFAVDAGMVMTAVHQNGDRFKLIGSSGYGVPDAIDLAKEAANGKYAVMGWVPTDDAQTQDWIKRLATYSKFPANDHNTSAYDGTNILLKVIDSAGTDPQAIRSGLSSTRGYKGIAGEYTFDSKGESLRQAYLVQIQNGKPQLLQLVKQDAGS